MNRTEIAKMRIKKEYLNFRNANPCVLLIQVFKVVRNHSILSQLIIPWEWDDSLFNNGHPSFFLSYKPEATRKPRLSLRLLVLLALR